MTDTISSRRGRPKGSVLPKDRALLAKLATYMLDHPQAPIAEAVRQVTPNLKVSEANAAIYRLRRKFKAERDALMATARQRREQAHTPLRHNAGVAVSNRHDTALGKMMEEVRAVLRPIEEMENLLKPLRQAQGLMSSPELRQAVERKRKMEEATAPIRRVLENLQLPRHLRGF